MLKKIFFIILVLFLPFRLMADEKATSTMQTIYSNSNLIIDYFDNKQSYNFKNNEVNINVLFEFQKNEKNVYGYNIFEINYNNQKKTIKYARNKFSGEVKVISVDKTDIFCNKNLVFITISNYVISSGKPINNYYQIFIDMNKENYFKVIDLSNTNTNGYIEADELSKFITMKCNENDIEYSYIH